MLSSANFAFHFRRKSSKWPNSANLAKTVYTMDSESLILFIPDNSARAASRRIFEIIFAKMIPTFAKFCVGTR